MQIFAVLLKLFAFTFRRYNEFFVLQSKLKEFHGTITILFEGIDSGTYSKKWLIMHRSDFFTFTLSPQ